MTGEGQRLCFPPPPARFYIRNLRKIDMKLSFDLEHIRIDKYDGGPIRGVLLFQQRDLN